VVAGVVCAPTGPGEAACLPAAAVGAMAVLGCAGGAAATSLPTPHTSSVPDDTCKPAKPDVEPADLCEELALAEAKAGAGTDIMGLMGDEPRLIALYGPGPWRKRQHIHVCANGRRLVIHYFSNGLMNVELKFK
jgi:hypothetical protein